MPIGAEEVRHVEGLEKKVSMARGGGTTRLTGDK